MQQIFIFINHLPKKRESKVDVTLECDVIYISLAKDHWYLWSVDRTQFFPVLYKFLFFCLVQFSHSVVSNSLWTLGLQHTRPPCPSPTPRVYSNSCPLSRWCQPNISSSVVPFSSCLQYFPASGSFQNSQFFTSGGQRTGTSASASVLPMSIQDWFPLGWTGWISLQFKSINSSTFSYLYSPSLTSIRNYWKNHSFYQKVLWWWSNVSAF